MRKLIYLLMVVSAGFVACEGDPGPPGPPGLDGGIEYAKVFEYTVNFNSSNSYSSLQNFPSNVEVFESDVVMAYQLVAVENGIDIWEPLPRTLFFTDGILMYGFDHSYVDINFFLDGTVDLGLLDSSLSQSQTFRVAVIPAEFAQDLNTADLTGVMNALNISEVVKVD